MNITHERLLGRHIYHLKAFVTNDLWSRKVNNELTSDFRLYKLLFADFNSLPIEEDLVQILSYSCVLKKEYVKARQIMAAFSFVLTLINEICEGFSSSRKCGRLIVQFSVCTFVFKQRFIITYPFPIIPQELYKGKEALNRSWDTGVTTTRPRPLSCEATKSTNSRNLFQCHSALINHMANGGGNQENNTNHRGSTKKK